MIDTLPKVQLASFCPGAAAYYDVLASVLPTFGVTTLRDTVEFLVQTNHETRGYTVFEENLNYSAQGLVDTWPTRFWLPSNDAPTKPASKADARVYARRPIEIADYVYAGRNGNGDIRSGDGYTFRGRGPIQVTFRDNYRAASIDCYGDDRLVLKPDAVADPKTGIRVAASFWRRHKLSAVTDLRQIRRVVVGGSLGLQDCIALRAKARTIFGV